MTELIEYEVFELIFETHYDYNDGACTEYYEVVDIDSVATLFLPETEDLSKLSELAIDRLKYLEYIPKSIYTYVRGNILSFDIIDDVKGKPLFRVIGR